MWRPPADVADRGAFAKRASSRAAARSAPATLFRACVADGTEAGSDQPGLEGRGPRSRGPVGVDDVLAEAGAGYGASAQRNPCSLSAWAAAGLSARSEPSGCRAKRPGAASWTRRHRNTLSLTTQRISRTKRLPCARLPARSRTRTITRARTRRPRCRADRSTCVEGFDRRSRKRADWLAGS